MPPLKIIEKDGFKFEINSTLCGTLAYVFYVDDIIIYKNNDYRPSAEALNDNKVMFKELSYLIIRDEKRETWSTKSEEKFLHSDRFKQFKALDKSF